MKNTITPISTMILLAAIMFMISCTQTTTDRHQDEIVHHDQDSEEDHGHTGDSEEEHHHEDDDKTIGLWKPYGSGSESIQADFHFITGSMEDIDPQIIGKEEGESILELTANGNPTAFVFHQSYGDVGVAAVINTAGFSGTVKLLHHATTDQNYDYVAVNDQKMTLGRVMAGNQTTLDEGDFEAGGDGWLTLRASAAGDHFKGYVADDMVTHGHGDAMKDGYAGIMIEGTGKVQIKSIEAVGLEE